MYPGGAIGDIPWGDMAGILPIEGMGGIVDIPGPIPCPLLFKVL